MSRKKNMYNELKNALGASDASCEYAELLLRCHMSEHTTEADIKSMSEATGIKLNSFDICALEKHLRYGYFVAIQQHFELFLHSLIKEVNRYCSSTIKHSSDKSLLYEAYFSVFPSKEKESSAYYLYCICDYYRTIRNEGAHGNEKGLAMKAYTTLYTLSDELAPFRGKLQAPNPPDCLAFDDFVFYTRSVKLLAKEMLGNLHYSPELIAENYSVDRIRKRKNSPEQCRRYLHNDLTIEFGLTPEILTEVIDKILERL